MFVISNAYVIYKICFKGACVFCLELTLPMSAFSDGVWWFAGPMGCVGLDVEGVTGGGLQVPNDLLQRHFTDSLLIFHIHWVWRRNNGKEKQR